MSKRESTSSSPSAKRSKMDSELDQKCINTIRVLSADTVQKANSGHPGAPMGCAPMAHVLWSRIMDYSPTQPKWFARDRYVQSNGHASALIYSMLHLTGYDLTMDDLKQFRQLGSKTPGHPENHLTAGVEVSTGPLGQGISNAVGLAMAESHLAAKFNRDGHDVVDNYTYVMCGDGCLQEGVASEACSLAGHLKLGKLIVLYDDNKITIDGATDLSFSEDVLKRFEAYGWHTSTVSDGDAGPDGIEKAVLEAKAVTDKPSIIKVATTIGFGSAKEGTQKTHGSPLGAEDLANVKKKFGFDPDQSFVVPDNVSAFYRKNIEDGKAKVAAWEAKFAKYKAAHPDLAAELERVMKGELPAGWVEKMPKWTPADKALATRQSSEIVINALAQAIPELVGGSADLTPSNLSLFKDAQNYDPAHRDGRYIRFGVREHGMAAICNGITAYGGLIPYCATFLNFLMYCIPSVRLSALSHLRVIYVMTHDSIGLGEDGPTHQPVEALISTRAMPNILTFRPADANEVAGSYVVAIENKDRPSVLALTRQGTPHLANSSIDQTRKGAYTVVDTDGKPDAILVASGSEVGVCLEAAKLTGLKTRVVSMPCSELFDEQTKDYRDSVLVPGVPTVSVEAAAVHSWAKYAHRHVGMTTFGASAPGPALFKHFGFTPEKVADEVKRLQKEYPTAPLLNI